MLYITKSYYAFICHLGAHISPGYSAKTAGMTRNLINLKEDEVTSSEEPMQRLNSTEGKYIHYQLLKMLHTKL